MAYIWMINETIHANKRQRRLKHSEGVWSWWWLLYECARGSMGFKVQTLYCSVNISMIVPRQRPGQWGSNWAGQIRSTWSGLSRQRLCEPRSLREHLRISWNERIFQIGDTREGPPLTHIRLLFRSGLSSGSEIPTAMMDGVRYLHSLRRRNTRGRGSTTLVALVRSFGNQDHTRDENERLVPSIAPSIETMLHFDVRCPTDCPH